MRMPSDVRVEQGARRTSVMLVVLLIAFLSGLTLLIVAARMAPQSVQEVSTTAGPVITLMATMTPFVDRAR